MPVLRWLERHFEEALCCIALSIIACSVFIQVLARYVFDIPLHWTEEVAAISMVWAVLGLFFAPKIGIGLIASLAIFSFTILSSRDT